MATAEVRHSQRKFKGMLLELLPCQGNWSEEQYLDLTDHSNRLVEFTDGFLEFLPMPTTKHQRILSYLFIAFEEFLEPLGGLVLFAPLRLKIREDKFREPDLIAVKAKDDPRAQDRFWMGADLVVEGVSKDKRQRDLVEKRRDYAEGRVLEYWIVDPQKETVTVLALHRKRYKKHGSFRMGQKASSIILPGFELDVANAMNA
jgi:Uma2 family endonuclease